MPETTSVVEQFEELRPRLFAIAYRMLSSASEAEDVVQDAFLRFDQARPEELRSPAAWLTAVVTNLCLDRLKSARARRERYVGPWLPEPVLTGDGSGASSGALGPLETAEQRESVSFAFLLLLERLNPRERAVFVLREAFAYGYDEIARILGLSEANCRQLYHRARQHVSEERARFQPSPRRRRELVERFIAAAEGGDLKALEALFAEDVTMWGDGGGKVAAARHPLVGIAEVLRFLAGLARRYADALTLRPAELNGGPGMLVYLDGKLDSAWSFDLDAEGGRITAIRGVRNPDKLVFLARQLEPESG
jgi:RNA polymerase sigma-70 factor (ECF subfamily)